MQLTVSGNSTMTFPAIARMSDAPDDRPRFPVPAVPPQQMTDRDNTLDPVADAEATPTRFWRCVHTISAHNAWVRSVAVSPDSQRIASASGDRTIKLWSTQTGEHIRTLRRHSGWIRGVVFSPDGKLLASVSSDRTLRLWDTRTGELRRTWLAHDAWVGAVAFSPDGQRIATGSQDCSIKIWHLNRTEPLQVLSGHTHWIRTVAFSADGRYLASGSRDRTVRLWQVATGASSQPIEAHSGEVWSVAFDPHYADRIASCGADGMAKLWKWTVADQLGAFNPPASANATDPDNSRTASQAPAHRTSQTTTPALTTLAFQPSQPILAAAGQGKTICLWHTTSAQLLDTLDEHQSWIWSVSFSRDGQFLVSGDWTGIIKIWRP